MPDIVELPALWTRPLFTARVTVAAPHVVGGPPGAGRRISDVSGGSFAGDRLRGTILPGGTDWIIERGDGAIQLDARIILRTDDDALIAMAYTGLRHGPADVMARLGRGEAVDPADYYFRIVPNFSTSDPRYEWLNRIVAIGVGHRTAQGPIYQVHEVM
jgi:hypothetical protein